MRLLFIRHGQSENNALWARTQSSIGRTADPGLTEIGKLQIEKAALFLKEKLDPKNFLYRDAVFGNSGSEIYLFCSLMDRAIQSGLIISKKLSLKLQGHLDIHECGGLYLEDPITNERSIERGKTDKEFREAYPDLILPDGVKHDGWWNKPFEERESRRFRADSVMKALYNRFGSRDVIVILVSHAGFYNYTLRSLLELRDDTDVWFDLYNAAVTLIEFSEETKNLIFCNRFDYLPTELLTYGN